MKLTRSSVRILTIFSVITSLVPHRGSASPIWRVTRSSTLLGVLWTKIMLMISIRDQSSRSRSCASQLVLHLGWELGAVTDHSSKIGGLAWLTKATLQYKVIRSFTVTDVGHWCVLLI